jgi:hypothetical protein
VLLPGSMEVIRVIDPNQLDPEARELWDWVFPGGFWTGAPHQEGPGFRLWSFAYICQFELGRVPRVVEEAMDPRIGPMVAEYIRNMRAAREKEA